MVNFMDSLSQFELIGGIVVGLTAIFVLFKYFNEHLEKQNNIYNQFNENLVKCTLAIDNLNKYIEKMEKEVKETLNDHEKRLDQHQEALIKLSNYRNITINNGGNKDE